MASPGVTTKPILLISGKSPFCETFFDNVKVPRRNLVGEPNKGWEIAKYLLTHEREMISRSATGLEPLGQSALARSAPMRRAVWPIRCCAPRSPAFEVDEIRVPAAARAHRRPGAPGQGNPALSSLLKYYGAELNKRRYELLMRPAAATASNGKASAPTTGSLARTWLRTKANSIEGGTSEVQLNIVAKRILGLPGA
jgi:acyl-CoA dehydrogenase